MRLVHTLFVVVVATALVAGATAYAGSREATIERHRIAIDLVTKANTDKGTFTVYPLRPIAGAFAKDSGMVDLGGAAFGTIMRNGMAVLEFVTEPRLDGRRGTLKIAQRFETKKMQNGATVGVGTWKIAKGTGAYSGVKGGGRLVHLWTPDGRTFVRLEGWVTSPG